MEACRAAGVPCQVVPGISAGMAAAAAAGAPLTHRGLAQAVTFVTGHAASGGEPELDWAALARANQTVVVYMGLSTAPMIAARLMRAGRQGSTPVAVIEGASLDTERRLVTTLSGLAEAVQGLDGPAILIIGEVASLATSLQPAHPGEGRDPGQHPRLPSNDADALGTLAQLPVPTCPGSRPSPGRAERKSASRGARR